MSQVASVKKADGSDALATQSGVAEFIAANTPQLKSMHSTAELQRRPSRAPDYSTESRALVTLAKEMAASPDRILQRLAETALTVCRAHSAGISLLKDKQRNFHWPAIAGQWASHQGGGTPRDFGPCGTVLDRNMPLLCSHPELDFPYFGAVTPVVEEALLVPFYVLGEAFGTIWVVAHDSTRRFDSEDLRMLHSLATFTSAAYQTLISLKASQQSAAIVNFSDDAIVAKDLNGVITSWNKGAERLFGYSAGEIIGQPVITLIPLDRRNEETNILQRVRRGESVEHYETVRRRKDGSLVEISLAVSPIKNTEGEVIGASKIARDITARKKSQEQVALLAREVDHRGKNLLALVQAIVQLTNADSADDFKTAIQGRIQALAKVHTVLAQSQWGGADLHHLVSEQLAPYCSEIERRARVDGPKLALQADTAQSIAMLLHELATNAVKYGAFSRPGGSVQVEWRRSDDGQLALRWQETGGPPVRAPSRQGFGTRVMEGIIRHQMKGQMRLDWRPEGLVCEIALQA
jgi:PAS domain S-box-containing protein